MALSLPSLTLKSEDLFGYGETGKLSHFHEEVRYVYVDQSDTTITQCNSSASLHQQDTAGNAPMCHQACLDLVTKGINTFKSSYMFKSGHLKGHLMHELESKFEGNVEIHINHNDKSVHLTVGKTRNAKQDITEVVATVLEDMEKDIIVHSVGLPVAEVDYEVILKKIDHFLGQYGRIHGSRTHPKRDYVHFVFQSEDDRHLIQIMFEIMAKQFIIETKLDIKTWAGDEKIKQIQSECAIFPVIINIHDGTLTLTGHECDVDDAKRHVRYIFNGRYLHSFPVPVNEYTIPKHIESNRELECLMDHGRLFIESSDRRTIADAICNLMGHTKVRNFTFGIHEENKIYFVLECAKTNIEERFKKESLRIFPGSDNKSVNISSTKAGYKGCIQELKVIKSRRYGIPQKCETLLQQLQRNRRMGAAYIVLMKKRSVEVQIKYGRIEKETVDVVVNSINAELVMNTSKKDTITSSLFSLAKDAAQVWLDQNKTTPIPYGEVIDGVSGELPCKRLYHVVLQNYNEKQSKDRKKELGSVVKKCLTMAAQNGHKSISFPAICTGVLRYPHDMVADTMLEAMVKYINEERDSPLRHINIVILTSDEKIKTKFDECRKQREDQTKAKGSLQEDSSWATYYYCDIVSASNDDLKKNVADINAKIKQHLEVTLKQ